MNKIPQILFSFENLQQFFWCIWRYAYRVWWVLWWPWAFRKNKMPAQADISLFVKFTIIFFLWYPAFKKLPLAFTPCRATQFGVYTNSSLQSALPHGSLVPIKTHPSGLYPPHNVPKASSSNQVLSNNFNHSEPCGWHTNLWLLCMFMMHCFGEILGGVVSHDSKDQIHNNW
jgi:hypothetical protein